MEGVIVGGDMDGGIGIQVRCLFIYKGRSFLFSAKVGRLLYCLSALITSTLTEPRWSVWKE